MWSSAFAWIWTAWCIISCWWLIYVFKELYLIYKNFYFEIIFRLMKGCKYSTNIPIFFLQLPLMVTSYVAMIHFSRLKINISTILFIKPVAHLYLLSFPTNIFFSVSGFSQWYQMAFSCHISLGSQSMTVLQSFLVFYSLVLLKNIGQVLCKMSINLDYPMFPHD